MWGIKSRTSLPSVIVVALQSARVCSVARVWTERRKSSRAADVRPHRGDHRLPQRVVTANQAFVALPQSFEEIPMREPIRLPSGASVTDRTRQDQVPNLVEVNEHPPP